MLYVNGQQLNINCFPDNTLRISLLSSVDTVTIKWMYECEEELVWLQMIVPHLRQLQVKKLTLDMPYIPNARMDRTHNPDEVFTLKHFCNIINNLHFDIVRVRDAHSNVALALLNNVESVPVLKYIKSAIQASNPHIVFYPDEGSCKRYSETVKFPCAFGIKKRDWDTGKILGLDVVGELPKSNFTALIVDDISSYGGTFLHSAKKLKELGAEKVYLYVTHCENSILNGELINSGLVEKIFTTQSIFTKEHPLIEIMEA